MRLLVLGGSWFVGRILVDGALQRGWDVTTFSRGVSGSAPDRAVFVRGDRDKASDLRALASAGTWDVVLDVAGAVPSAVRDSARILSEVAARYVFVSTISVYRDWPHSPVSEHSAVWDGDADHDPGTRDWDPEAYGPLKVGCELAVARSFATDSRLILRPHVVLGPYEYVGRLPWWLARMQRGGHVLAPAPDRTIQPIDVRDLATFTLDQIEREASGIFNVAAPVGQTTYGEMLRACADAVADVAEKPARLEWVDEDWLVSQGVTQWTTLPLWRNAAAPWSMETRKAQDAGLKSRPLRATVNDTWAWLRNGGRAVPHERSSEHGLRPDQETVLLRKWDQALAMSRRDPSQTHG